MNKTTGYRWARLATVLVGGVTLAASFASPAAAAGGQPYVDNPNDFVNILPGSTASGDLGVGAIGAVTVTNVTLTDPTGAFSIDASECINATVGTVQHPECPVHLSFTPQTAGDYGATVTVATTGGDVAQPLSATAHDAFVSLIVTDFVDAGIVPMGETTSQRVDVINIGNVAGTIAVNVTNPGDGFSAPDSVVVPPGGFGTVDVAITPAHLFGLGTQLVFTHDADVWSTTVAATAYSRPGDDQATATPMPDTGQFDDAVYLGWATTSSSESECGIRDGAWYRYTATVDSVVRYQFSAEFPVASGEATPTSGSCGGDPGGVHYAQVLAGQTSYFFAGIDTSRCCASNPVLFFNATITPLEHIGLTLSPKGVVDKRGTITITGTGTSDPPAGVIVHATAQQKSGHGYILSEALGGWSFDSNRATWTLVLVPSAGKFVAGPAQVVVDAYDANAEPRGTHPSISATLKLAAKG